MSCPHRVTDHTGSIIRWASIGGNCQILQYLVSGALSYEFGKVTVDYCAIGSKRVAAHPLYMFVLLH